MLTITKEEHERQWCRTKTVFEHNVAVLTSNQDLHRSSPENSRESFFYLWIMGQWEQDRFENRQYNNCTTAENIQIIYKRINQIY